MSHPDFDLGSIRRAGAPRIERLGHVAADIDLHGVALTLQCPALIERGDAPREQWHVLPVFPRGTLEARDGEVAIAWLGDEGGVLRREGRGLDALRELLAAVATPAPSTDIPFAGGLVVLLAHDLAHEIERLPRTTEDRDELPWLVAHACPAAVLVPTAGGEALLAWLPATSEGGAEWGLSPQEARMYAAWARHALADPSDHEPLHGRPAGPVRALWGQSEHESAVRRIIEDLHAGEIYQANLSQRFEVEWEGSALPLHAVLRLSNPSPFSGWMRKLGGEWDVISGSPERLVKLVGRELVTEPIAGTIPLPRGPLTTNEEVTAAKERLASSTKDHAEHVMIVDLHRNDLGRVSAPGTVRVEQMMRIDRRSHVVQAIADIRGTLAEGRDAVDVIEAMFPGGCVTGVPKIRAMEILDGLERWNRGPYTGSFGYVASWGDMDLNVLIRSAWQRGGLLAFSAGGGVVLDSDPAREYEESLAKAAAMRDAVTSLRERP